MDFSSASPAHRPRLLLVESDAAMRSMLVEAFSPGYHVEAFSSGAAAWEAVRRHPPDLVIIGLCLHGRDGLGFIRSLRADAKTARLPILMLTSSAERPQLLRCLEAGATNFLLKPFGLGELLACVRSELTAHAVS